MSIIVYNGWMLLFLIVFTHLIIYLIIIPNFIEFYIVNI